MRFTETRSLTYTCMCIRGMRVTHLRESPSIRATSLDRSINRGNSVSCAIDFATYLREMRSNLAFNRTRGHAASCSPASVSAGRLTWLRSALKPRGAESASDGGVGGGDRQMALSQRAKKLVAEIGNGKPKLGDLKRRGKEIKKDHELAMELWSTGDYYPRLLSTLIFDTKLLTEMVIDQLASDMLRHDAEQCNQLADW